MAMTRFTVARVLVMAGCGHAPVAKTAPSSPPAPRAAVVLLSSDPSTWVKTGENPQRRELRGYEAYTRTTSYRIVPFVW
jgi:hypothetical protein